MNHKYNLRTFDNIQHIYFTKDPNFKNHISITNLSHLTSKTFFVLDNVLSDVECDMLIRKSNDKYETLENEFPKQERDANRCLAMDDYFAQVLYARISKYINQNYKGEIPCGFGTIGQWQPYKINKCFRYSQYISPSGGFEPHRDATYLDHEDTRSILTITIYLNDDFEGGKTVFYKTTNKRTKEQLVKDEMSNGYKIRYLYNPRKGSVLIFNNNMIHEDGSIK